MPQSKEAHSKYMREVWYPKNRLKHIRMVAVSRQKRIKKLYELANKIKTEKGCKDCGIKDFRVLDFDHLRDKIINLAVMIGEGWAKSKIVAEIAKCEVRCANCHRIKTWQRKRDGVA